MNILSFDIEIYNELEEDETGKQKYEDIIPSIAAFTEDGIDVEFFYDEPFMTKKTAQGLGETIRDKMKAGTTLLAWNGTSFDNRVMGLYSEAVDLWGEIAILSYDPMLSVTFRKGYFLGLDKALIGANIESKLHTVTLKDGTVLNDMNGSKAPELWRNKEYEAVKAYLHMDVTQPYKLAKLLEKTGKIRWTSGSGKPMVCDAPLEPVYKLFEIPFPDVSWMSSPPVRSQFIDWIPMEIQRKHIESMKFQIEEDDLPF